MAQKIGAEDLHALRDGRMSFAQWYRRNAVGIAAIATWAHRRYRAPGFDLDDVVQVMLMSVWESLPLWDGRVVIDSYVRYRAVTAVGATAAKLQKRQRCRLNEPEREVFGVELGGVGSAEVASNEQRIDAASTLRDLDCVEAWVVGEVCEGKTAREIARDVCSDDVLCFELGVGPGEPGDRARGVRKVAAARAAVVQRIDRVTERMVAT